MESLLKYTEEPQYFMIRESLMNFCKDQTVAKRIDPDKKYKVDQVFGKTVRICDRNACQSVHYSELITFDYPYEKPNKAFAGWQTSEINYIKENISMPNATIARLLGRTEGSILAKKFKIREITKVKTQNT